MPGWRERDAASGIGPLEQEDVARMFSDSTAGRVLDGFGGVVDLLPEKELYLTARVQDQRHPTQRSPAEDLACGSACKGKGESRDT